MILFGLRIWQRKRFRWRFASRATYWTRAVAEHPVLRLYDAGVPIILNTDDPALFECTLTSEYALARREFAFSEEELAGLVENSFLYAFFMIALCHARLSADCVGWRFVRATAYRLLSRDGQRGFAGAVRSA